jgi:hypothetical protein
MTQITHEAVEAALQEWVKHPLGNRAGDTMRAALTAALPHMQGWQGIASAPEGIVVLLKQGKRIQSGFMKRNTQYGSVTAQTISRASGDYASATSQGFMPDEWQPLPCPLKWGA